MAGENLIDILEYNEAKRMIDLPIIDKNHRILEDATRRVDDSVLICENPEIQLNQIRTEVFFLMPDFLVNPEDKELKYLKKMIELNINNFEKLCKNLNDFVQKISGSLNNLNKPSLDLKKEINSIIKKFEDTIKGLCAPLISQREGINTIDTTMLTEEQKRELEADKIIIDKEINQFLEESDKLNKNYHILFSQMLESIKIICDTINDIPIPVQELQNEVEEGLSKFEEFLESINDENKVQNFNNIIAEVNIFYDAMKKKADNIKLNTQNKCNILDNQYKKRHESFDKLKIKVRENIEKLTVKAEKIKFDIINIREKYKQKKIELPQMTLSEIIIEKVYNALDKTIEQEKQDFEQIPVLPVEPPKLSVDLLYIMDITGSMEGYVNATKIGLIDIMENIIACCNEMVTINLGFIGYKDVAEIKTKDYVDKDFTNDHFAVKDDITKIIVGGGDDTAEDVAFAFERALDKNWGEESIKFAILICDAPCHGIVYHDPNLIDDYPNGVPNREKIENLVDRLCCKNISLCCVKLSKETDKMYSLFKQIYESRKNDKCGFYLASISDPKNLADIIINNSSDAIKKFA